MKKHRSEWKTIFSSDTSDKRLISKIYKELIELNTKATTITTANNPIKKVKGNKHFFKEDI